MAGAASSSKSIGEVGEFRFLSDLVSRLRRGKGVVVGPGQDCAVLGVGRQRLLATVDVLVDGVHFRADWMSPKQLGRRSFLVNASDIAAMGGRPRWCLVSILVPGGYSRRALESIHRGIDEAAAQAGASVVGGNLSRNSRLSISVTLIAEAPSRIVTREGARPGDGIFVTGTLGDAAFGVRCLRNGAPAAHAIRRYREPTPRLTAGRLLVESGVVSAMIDVSDGLIQDLGHLCEESRVGAAVDAGRLPLSPAVRRHLDGKPDLALAGGEDYELLCTVPARKQALLEELRPRLRCPITAIGRITEKRRMRVVDAAGKAIRIPRSGYDHFV